jgi:hypothetical protein
MVCQNFAGGRAAKCTFCTNWDGRKTASIAYGDDTFKSMMEDEEACQGEGFPAYSIVSKDGGYDWQKGDEGYVKGAELDHPMEGGEIKDFDGEGFLVTGPNQFDQTHVFDSSEYGPDYQYACAEQFGKRACFGQNK